MNTSSLTNNEQLALLKSAYYAALASYNKSENRDELIRLYDSMNAYMSFKSRHNDPFETFT
jgi:hypothetical protein